MFAVPGWSVSPTLLKTESEPSSIQNKKRPLVTAENVADLWEEKIEGRSAMRNDKDKHGNTDVPRKKQRRGKDKAWREILNQNEARLQSSAPTNPGIRMNQSLEVQKPRPEKPDRKAQHTLKHKSSHSDAADMEANGRAVTSNLTTLQDSMRRKLTSARFRYLNETLYTSRSADAKQLFQSDPSMFEDYHTGFRQQVSLWPQNPVDCFAQDVEARATDARGKRSDQLDASTGTRQSQYSQEPPIPRTKQICTIADLGCGDAGLAKALQPLKKRLKIRVLSYDLQSSQPEVIKADIANLPLQDGEINVAIFCLALMGTNWTDFIDEAWRILQWKGELWIAEIKSRFSRKIERSKDAHASKRPKKMKSGQGRSDGAESNIEMEEHLNVEVDGMRYDEGQADIVPFVNILRRRGFTLQDQAAVDTSNKMFVRMKFIKNVRPTKGKNHSRPQGGTATRTPCKSYKWGQLQDEPDSADEAKALKPCLYKQR